MLNNNKNWLTRIGIVVTLPLAALSLAGCATSGSEEGADVEDVVEENEPLEDEVLEDEAGPYAYDGIYDETFYDEYENYLGEEVTVSADVNEIVSDESFTIAGGFETTVEALLIVGATADVEEGESVKVTGIVRQAFDLPTVESDMGLDLDDDLYMDWDGQNYIEASSVTPIPDE